MVGVSRKGLSASWLVNQRRFLDDDLLPALGRIPVTQITTDDIRDVMKAGKARISAAHANRLRMTVRMILDCARDEHRVGTGPCARGNGDYP